MVVKRSAAGGGKKRISNVELEQGKRFATLKFDSQPVQIFAEPSVDTSFRIKSTQVLLLNVNGAVIGAVDPGLGVILNAIKTETHLFVVYLQKVIRVSLRDMQEMEVVLSIVSRITLVAHSSTMNSLFILDIEDTLRIIDTEKDEGKTMTTLQGIVNFCVHSSGPWMCACSAEDASILIYFLNPLNKVKGVNKVCSVEGHWDVFVQQMAWLEDAVYYKLSNQNIYKVPFDDEQILQCVGGVQTVKRGRPRLDSNIAVSTSPKRKQPNKPRKTTSVENENIIITSGRPKRAAARKISYKEVHLDELEDRRDQKFSPDETEDEEEEFIESE